MSPLELSSPTTEGPENCSTAEAQNKGLKMAFMNIIMILKEEMNKSFKEMYENTSSGRT